MKKKIVAALKEHEIFGKLSEAVLNRVAEKLVSDKVVKEEADIEGAIGELSIAKVVEAYADARANEAQQTAVKNYETKHNLKDGKPLQQPDPEPKPKGDDDPKDNEQVKALMDSIKSLKDEIAAMKGADVTKSRKAKLEAAIKDAPEKVREQLVKNYERLTFKDDADFDTWLSETTTYATEISKSIVTPKPPTAPKAGGNGGEGASEGAKAYAAKIAAGQTSSALSGLSSNQQATPAPAAAK